MTRLRASAQPQHQVAETRFDRGARLTLGLAVLLILWPLATTLLGYTRPSDGWVYSSDGFRWSAVANLTDRPSQLREGDLLIAINGRPVEYSRPLPRSEGITVGRTLHYTVLRGGRTLEVDVSLVNRSPASLLRFIAHGIRRHSSDDLVPLLTLLIVTFVFSRRPGSQAARLLLLAFAYYCGVSWFANADWSFYVYTYPDPLAFLIVLNSYGWTWLFLPALIHLALVFPVRLWPVRRFPRLLPALLYGVPGLVGIVTASLSVTSHADLELLLFTTCLVTLAVIFFVTLLASFVHNFRMVRDPVVRAQLRWIALGLGVGWALPIAIAFLDLVVPAVGTLLPITDWLIVLLPLSLAIAITRYRLFDIDIIIRRTLIYSVLTAALAVVYFGGVGALQYLGRTMGGGERAQPEWIIVVSTLAIAALFQPLRHRIQIFIDRRFYRRKYDAARTLQEFSARLRDEVDINMLSKDLLSVVEETMRPEHASLWIKPAAIGGERRTIERKEHVDR